MKQSNNLRYIFKIHSNRLRRAKWNLNLGIREAMTGNDELVAIADSQILRFISQIRCQSVLDLNKEISVINNKIKSIKSKPTNMENKQNIRSLYISKYAKLFVPDYINIVMDSTKDYDRMVSKKGFYVNGLKYKRLYGTSGGQKKSTIVFVSELVYDELIKRINNGRNMNKEFVPAKLEAYKSLASSASISVSNPKGVLVVKDCETQFNANVIKVDDTVSEYPTITHEKDYPIILADSDGYGLLSPTISERWAKELMGENAYVPTGYCIRNSFCKGMLFTFDFYDFAESIAKNNIVKDAWGHEKNINNIEVILTTSMLKLWDSYDSIEDYLNCCKNNGYSFSITKVIDEHLESERNLNYQFIQSLKLDDEDIYELIVPTLKEIHDVLGEDPMKSLLFLKGIHFNDFTFDGSESDFIKALMVDKRMIADPFVRNKIHGMIKKRINEAKVGVLKIHGNFSVVSGDPYSLCQSIFGLTATGLLHAGKFYSKYWIDKGVSEVAGFRAPMTCHNNIRILSFENTQEMQHWYRYMPCCTIFNSWDTTTHSLNGCDKDGDSILTTDNAVVLKGIEELDAILCVQKTAQKKIPTESDFIQANKDSFGDEIGAITNRITEMFDVLANFEKGSPEYEELLYRISSGQNYQQNAIDKSKGIVAKSMPKEWYDFYSNIVKEDDDEETKQRKDFNLRILADKKPYFFIYVYPHLMKKYRTYLEKINKTCERKFGVGIEELIAKKNHSKEEETFLKFYYKKLPVSIGESVMNKICKRVEREFDGVQLTFKEHDFDYTLLMSNCGYSKKAFAEVSKLLSVYKQRIEEYSISARTSHIDTEEVKVGRKILKESFKIKANEICPNEEELCNIVVELCYRDNKSKQFAWDICGDRIILNLLQKNNYVIKYPILDRCGDIEFKGETFSIKTKQIGGYIDYENCFE